MFMARPPLIERVVLESRVQILKGEPKGDCKFSLFMKSEIRNKKYGNSGFLWIFLIQSP